MNSPNMLYKNNRRVSLEVQEGVQPRRVCVCVYVFQKIDVKMLLSICNFFSINKTNGFGSSWSLAGVWSLI